MKRILLVSVFSLVYIHFNAQTCRVQFIHNSADTSIQLIDIYVGSTVVVDDLMFRNATPFLDVSAGADQLLSVTAHDALSESEAFYTTTYSLLANQKYIVIANGVVATEMYNPAEPFGLVVKSDAIEAGNSSASAEVLFCNGSTDTPQIDFKEIELIQLTAFDDVDYNELAGYQSLLAANYVFEISNSDGSISYGTFQGQFDDLLLGGKGVVILTSGFLNQSLNNNGAPFGLWLTGPLGGPMVELPMISSSLTARVQLIHNSADMSAQEVDVYLGEDLLLDNFSYRTSSGFMDFPAGKSLHIHVAAAASESAAESFYSTSFYAYSGQTYTIIAEGIFSTSGYTPAPEFHLNVLSSAKETSPIVTDVYVQFEHGSTDAPVIDLQQVLPFNSTILENVSYASFASPISAAASDFVWKITDETGTVEIESYVIPFQSGGFAGQAVTVVASGFVDPSANSNGPAFGLWLADADGGDLLEIMPVPDAPVYAEAQFIHNSADGAALLVDVYMNDQLIVNDFAYRHASPYLQVPASVPVQISIAPWNSTSVDEAISQSYFTLSENEKYIFISKGILSNSGFNPSPDFGWDLFTGARPESQNTNEMDVLVYHGTTDAPALDVTAPYIPLNISDDLSFGSFSEYASMDATVDQAIKFTSGSGAFSFGEFSLYANAWSLMNKGVTIFVNGFLNPQNNSNGPDMQPWIALPDGTTYELPVHVGLDESNIPANYFLYPNPATDVLNVTFENRFPGACNYRIYNSCGELVGQNRLIKTFDQGRASIGIQHLPAGVYSIHFITDRANESRNFMIVR